MTTKRREMVDGKMRLVEYESRDAYCNKRWCFTPFSGNGLKICRRYETGNCTDGARTPADVEKKKEGEQ